MRNFLYLFMIIIAAFSFSCKKKQENDILRTGIVNFVDGSVLLITKAGTSPAAAGDIVKEGMTVKTGKNSIADIHFGVNVIKVLANTVLDISVLRENLAEGSEKTELMVQNGRMLSSVKKKLIKSDVYRVSTPTSIAAVRGTEFLVEELNNMTNISCISGSVYVRGVDDPEDKSVVVKEGEEGVVAKGASAVVRELSLDNKQNIQNIIDDIREMRKDIREKFEEDRDRIRQEVIDLRTKNKVMVEAQKAMDRENIENIKGGARKEMDEISEGAAVERDRAVEALNAQKEGLKEGVESLKQKVPRFGSGLQDDDSSEEKPKVEKFSPSLQ